MDRGSDKANLVARERRLRALGDAIAAYEAERGVMTAEDIARRQRKDRSEAWVISKAPRSRPSRTAGEG
jgi:hypothetical protein